MKPLSINSANELSEPRLERVRSLRILFGHQSVGRNILEGLQGLAAENAMYRLNLVETNAPEKTTGPVFASFSVGSNMNPDSKLVSFRDCLIKSGGAVDAALFKFCYADVGADTDGELLFSSYQKTITDLRKRFPDVTFVHATIPLTTLDNGVKRIVKMILGKSTGEKANANRTRYNELLRKEYAGKEPIFDIAAVESTAPDGSRLCVKKSDIMYESLCPAYTDDGGHLNSPGRRLCALALVSTLSDVSDRLRRK